MKVAAIGAFADRVDRDLLAAALASAERGWHVHPLHSVADHGRCSCGDLKCERIAKHPRTPHGCKDATTNVEQITKWWLQWPTANVGIATGAATGNLVLDVDPRHGGDRSLAELERVHGPLPETLLATTGGGGNHHYFQHPGGRVRNRADILPGLDVRGDGGFVVAPPSVHATGALYAWAPGHGPGEIPIAAAPAWLLDAIAKPKTKDLHARARAYCDRAQGVSAGSRNSTAFRLAGHLRALVANDGSRLTEREILELVLHWNRRNDPPLEVDELERCVQSSRVNGHPPSDKPPRGAGKARGPTPAFALTDIGNAERLLHRFGADIKYCAAWGWMVFDGARWRRDDLRAVELLAKQTVRAIHEEALPSLAQEERERLQRHAIKSESDARVRALLARAIPEAPSHPDEFDADPWLLNVENGTLDLRTGERREHRREDLITKLAPVHYEHGAKLEDLDQFLRFVTNDDPEYLQLLLRAVGYSLTGVQTEDKINLLIGPGNNGKSTFLGSLAALLGDYACTVPFEALLAREQGGSSGPRPELARCAGARVVTASEVEEGRAFNAATLKTLSGGDRIVVHEKYRDPFEMKPQFKLWLGANAAPRIRSNDTASRRRLTLLPFVCEPAKVDKSLRERLTQPDARSALLALAVKGCIAWQREGLGTCRSVERATARYWNDWQATDEVEAFVEECCERDALALTSTAVLHAAYCNRERSAGREPLADAVFGRALADLGFVDKRTSHARGWRGIRLAQGVTA